MDEVFECTKYRLTMDEASALPVELRRYWITRGAEQAAAANGQSPPSEGHVDPFGRRHP